MLMRIHLVCTKRYYACKIVPQLFKNWTAALLQIDQYPVDKWLGNQLRYPAAKSILSPFEQLGPARKLRSVLFEGCSRQNVASSRIAYV